jgi:hypothetical protein
LQYIVLRVARRSLRVVHTAWVTNRVTIGSHDGGQLVDGYCRSVRAISLPMPKYTSAASP